jgi:hypothetical protein
MHDLNAPRVHPHPRKARIPGVPACWGPGPAGVAAPYIHVTAPYGVEADQLSV